MKKRFRMLFSPHPRFRMYTEATDYLRALWGLTSGQYFKGNDCLELEEKIQSYFQIANAVCMPQARVGIYIGIAASIEPGKEVVLSPNTIADVINMVIAAGAVPVFCDIDPNTGNIDPELIEPLINENTAAIIATHLYGQVAPMDKLSEIGRKYNLVLIEDAAQAFGARYNHRWAGTLGDIGIFSFGMAKNIMAFFGGMLVTPNVDIAEAVRERMAILPVISKMKLRKKIFSCLIKDIFSSQVFFPKLIFPILRYGYQNKITAITRLIETELDLSMKQTLPNHYKERLSPMQARLITVKLKKLEADLDHRFSCACLYYEGLKDIDSLRLPPMIEDGSHVYNYYPIGYKNRKTLRMYMMNKNRDIALQHIKNTADLPAFKAYYRDCPHSRKWADETIMLPNYPKYSLDEVERNVKVIRNFFGK